MNTHAKHQNILLIVAAIGLTPIALSYGLVPHQTLTPLFGIAMDNVNLSHIMRAVMGLYFGQIIFWLLALFNPNLKLPAIYSLIIFMLGLAVGRLISIAMDGVPHWLLLVYLFLELLCGITGLLLVSKRNT